MLRSRPSVTPSSLHLQAHTCSSHGQRSALWRLSGRLAGHQELQCPAAVYLQCTGCLWGCMPLSSITSVNRHATCKHVLTRVYVHSNLLQLHLLEQPPHDQVYFAMSRYAVFTACCWPLLLHTPGGLCTEVCTTVENAIVICPKVRRACGWCAVQASCHACFACYAACCRISA